jgi:hypothetical protein
MIQALVRVLFHDELLCRTTALDVIFTTDPHFRHRMPPPPTRETRGCLGAPVRSPRCGLTYRRAYGAGDDVGACSSGPANAKEAG